MQCLFLLLCFFIGTHTLHAREIIRLDLNAAVSYALEHSPAFHNFKTQKEISELGVANVRSSLFPKFQLSASTGLSANHPSWPTKWNNGLTLGISQALLSSVANRIAIDVAKTKNRIAEYDVLYQRDILCMKVAKEFYAHRAAIEQLALTKQKLAMLFKQMELVNARYQNGLKRERDVLRFRAQVQQAQIQEVSAVNRVEQTKNVLMATITGSNRQEIDVDFYFDAQLPQIDLSRIPTREPIIAEHIIAKRYEQESSLVALNIELAKRQLWPDLSASLSGSTGFDFMLNRPHEILPTGSVMLGLSLQFELFDFGKRRRDVVIAAKNREIKLNSIKTELATETLAIAQVMASLRLSKESILLNQKLLTLEEDNFKKIESDYRQGKAQYLEVITALNSLADVRGALYAALYDLETQMVVHRFYEGRLYDWFF